MSMIKLGAVAALATISVLSGVNHTRPANQTADSRGYTVAAATAFTQPVVNLRKPMR